MTATGLIDLDGLVLRCRNTDARQYIEEAIACYRSGAFRACIVSTWTAVVYDYLAKLRELNDAGDKEAREKLRKFDNIRSSSNAKAAQGFEQEWLLSAKNDFEFLTPLEYVDFERLRNDRNRCAHPSMHSDEEPYQPTAELARYHLRNAVEHMLAAAPVQGKAALDRLEADIARATFPTDVVGARVHLQAGPIGNARESLVRNFVILLMKQLLREEYSVADRDRRYAALLATTEMHVDIAEPLFRSRLTEFANSLDDEVFPNLITFVGRVTGTWDCLALHCQQRAAAILKQLPLVEEARLIVDAFQVPALEPVAISQLCKLSHDTLSTVLVNEPRAAVIDEAIRRFGAAKSFEDARVMREALIVHLIDHVSLEQTRALLRTFIDNDQVRQSHGTCATLALLLDATELDADEVRDEWWGVRDTGAHEGLRGYAQLKAAIDARFPQFESEDLYEGEPADGEDDQW